MSNFRKPIKWSQYLTNPGVFIHSILDKIFKTKRFDWYEIKEGNILHHGNGKAEVICIDQVIYWKVYLEMIFDVIEIGYSNGSKRYFQDYYNDLINILSKNLADKIIK